MSNENIESASTVSVNEIRHQFKNPETIKLIAKRKEENWKDKEDVREMIEVRDILEYAAIKNIARALEASSENLANLTIDGEYSNEKVEKSFEELINKFKNELSQKQIEVLQRALNTILKSISEFNEWKTDHKADDIFTLLGDQFTNIDKAKAKVDTDRFPGVVVLELDDESYRTIRDGYRTIKDKSNNAFYGNNLGNGVLKGRVIVINSSIAHDKTARHEYQHFLFSQVANDIEILPEVSARKIEEENISLMNAYTNKKKRLEEERLEAELAVDEEYEEIGRVSNVTSNKLSEAEKKLDKLPKQLALSKITIEVKHKTYPEGPIKDAFNRFKNELMAYAVGQKKVSFETYFGDTLISAQENPYFPVFRAEMDLVRGLLSQAEKKGIPNETIGFLVGCARNMQQAAKYIYLEIQSLEVKTEDLSKKESSVAVI